MSKSPLPQNDMQVKETLRVNVKPYLTAEDLTMEQQALLEGYKNKGGGFDEVDWRNSCEGDGGCAAN